MHEIDLDRAKREEVRWRILRALDASRPYALAETTLHRTLCDADLPISPGQVRRELDYLMGKGLLALKRTGPTWSAELTGEGVDVVEYAAPAPPGVGRPQKWW